MKYTKEELCLIWLDSFVGLEYKHKRELFDMIKDSAEISRVLEKGKDYIISNCSESGYNTLKNSANKSYLDYVLKGLEGRGIRAITLVSNGYPHQLINTSLPPLVLYTMGDVELMDTECFAIVGSRKSLPVSIKIAENYTESLSTAGFTLVTGIAEGVDTAVVTKALECGGKVISVIASGFDNVYPSTNLDLIKKLAENGLVISEYPPETVSRPYFFPVRNRIIAGLSAGVLIISGGKKSGTLYTAGYANEYGRDLFAVPYGVGVTSGAGCNDLIKGGAMLTDTPDDILEYYGKEKSEDKMEFSDEEKAIIKVLADGEKHIDKISSETGKKVQELTPVLSMLEINGVVVKSGNNVYGLIRNDLEV